MSKRLPYFQFEPAEYLAGDIMFCSLSAQGLFSILKSIYWQKECILTLEAAIKRLGNKELFDELILEKIIKIEDGNIKINFLNEQFFNITNKSTVNSENGKKGAEARWRKQSESIATPLISDSESIALREDKIREDEIKEDSVVAPQPPKKSISDLEKEFYDMLLPFVEKFGKEMCRKFFNHWSEPNKSKTKLKWQMEKTWDTQKRLLKWESNGFDKPKGSYQQNTGNAATGFQMRNPHPKDLKD